MDRVTITKNGWAFCENNVPVNLNRVSTIVPSPGNEKKIDFSAYTYWIFETPQDRAAVYQELIAKMKEGW